MRHDRIGLREGNGMKVDLAGRTAIVTGAGGSIGEAIALALAANGANVVVNDVNEAGGMAVAEKCAALGTRSSFVHGDVSDKEQMEALAKKAEDDYGRIDILVNNAGVNVGPEGRKIISEFGDADWERIVRIDLNGIFYLSKPVSARMIRQGGGRILNISSIVGLVPLRLQSAFAAAKAGVVNLTKAMAIELAEHGIAVNCIAPGSILMEGTKALFYADPAKAERLLSHIPMHRPGRPEEIASVAAFLVSDDASYMTGSIVTVDGGWTCGFARDF
jgi:NAD(P)-dependent dehydrogenase (short-subunit alcohol dehydrogenase family)